MKKIWLLYSNFEYYSAVVRARLSQSGGGGSIILSKLAFLLIYFKSWHFNCWSISIINSDHLIVKLITQSSNHLEK